MTRSLLVCSVFTLSICAAQAQSKKPDKEPERLTILRTSWQQARNKATEPIDLKYRQELQKILESLTKAGDLDGALVVKQELEGLSADKVTDGRVDTGRSLLTRLRGTTWSFNEGNGELQFTFKDGKEVSWKDVRSQKVFPMKIEQMKDGSLFIPWGGTQDYRFDVAADHSTITVSRKDKPDKTFTATPVAKKKP